jgi:hypothetical protein
VQPTLGVSMQHLLELVGEGRGDGLRWESTAFWENKLLYKGVICLILIFSLFVKGMRHCLQTGQILLLVKHAVEDFVDEAASTCKTKKINAQNGAEK